MEENLLTRVHLESLTTGDLLKLADELKIDISDNLDRISIIEELLESADDDWDDDSEEQDLKDSVFNESVPLPKCYNITYIDVMIRDPFWAFVFWEVKSFDKEQIEKNPDFNGYYLKVTSLPHFTPGNGRGGDPGTEDVFTVQVKPDDTAWYLGFSQGAESGSPEKPGRYKVELCAALNGGETVLAVSSPIRLPGLPELLNKELSENQLVCLSGYGAFHILRKNERPLKNKGIRSLPGSASE
jgi:hypothetical protein